MKIAGRLWSDGTRRYLIIELPRLALDQGLLGQLKNWSLVKKARSLLTAGIDLKVEIRITRSGELTITSNVEDRADGLPP